MQGSDSQSEVFKQMGERLDKLEAEQAELKETQISSSEEIKTVHAEQLAGMTSLVNEMMEKFNEGFAVQGKAPAGDLSSIETRI